MPLAPPLPTHPTSKWAQLQPQVDVCGWCQSGVVSATQQRGNQGPLAHDFYHTPTTANTPVRRV